MDKKSNQSPAASLKPVILSLSLIALIGFLCYAGTFDDKFHLVVKEKLFGQRRIFKGEIVLNLLFGFAPVGVAHRKLFLLLHRINIKLLHFQEFFNNVPHLWRI